MQLVAPLVVDYSASCKLIVNYFASAARPSALARHAARHAAVAPLVVDYSTSRRLVVDYSALPRLVVDYSVRCDFVLRPRWLYFIHAVRRDYLSRGNTSSTSSMPRAATTSSSGRIASTFHLD
jgi:hypothetical protein